jgi:hypothetical protein
MDLGGQYRIGAPDLAGAQAAGDIGFSLGLPILKEEQVCCRTLVLHLSQCAAQCLGTRTTLFGYAGSHRHPPWIVDASRS